MEQRKDIARELGRKYHPLSPESLDALASILIPVRYKRGDIMLRQGDVCKYLFFIEKGVVRQFYYKNNKEVTEHISIDGRMVICIESYFQQIPTKLIVEALEPTLIYLIPYDQIERLAASNHEIEIFYRKIVEHALIRSQVWADVHRFESAYERYKRYIESQPDVILRASLVHIASFLQMTPETLSRVRAQLAAEQRKARQEALKHKMP